MRDAAVAVQQRGEALELGVRRRDHRPRRQQAGDLGRRRIGGGLQRHIARQHDHRDAALADRLADGDFEDARQLLRTRKPVRNSGCIP